MLLSSLAHADSVTLKPVADNIMFLRAGTPQDFVSSGSGTGIYTGRTDYHEAGSRIERG